MNEKLQIAFGLLGGLAIFIYGMNMMSECLQKAAGEKMKSILALLTKNPLLGVLAGAVTTAVLQSSSATTNGDGNRVCECRTDESAAGNFDYFWCKYRNYDDRTDHCF